MRVQTYAEMGRLSKEDLIRNLDQMLGSHGPIVDIEFIKEEIWHRDAEQVNQRMERMTIAHLLYSGPHHRECSPGWY